MGLFNSLRAINNSCSIEISNGEYIDISNTGVLGLSQKRSTFSLNNGIIAGISCEGRSALIDSLLYDAVNSGKPVVYIRNRVNNQVFGRFGIEIEQGVLGNQAIIIDINKKNTGINLFKGMSLDMITDCLIEIMSNYIVVDDTMRDFSTIWYDKIFEVLKLCVPKEKFSLLQLKDYSFDWLKNKYVDLYRKNYLNQSRYSVLTDELRKISGVYQSQMLKFSVFAKKIESGGLTKILSGKTNIRDICKKKMVLMVNLNEGTNPKETEVFLSLLLKRLVVEETSNFNSSVCVFEDSNVKENATSFISLLQASQAKGSLGSVYFTEKNITWWTENTTKVAEHPANYCNAFFVFRQNVNSDLKYWSALSGAVKKIEVSHNQAPMHSVYRLDTYSWTSILFGRKMVCSGNSFKEVDSYRVEEQQIDSLDERSCITIIKMQEYIYNRKVTWV